MKDHSEIRVYRESDLARLQEITAQTFGPVSIDRNMEERLGAFGPGDWQSRKVLAIAEDCRLQPDGVFVADDGTGQAIGYVTTRLVNASGIGWIPNLAVDPDYQGKGIGRMLLLHAIDYLRVSGMEVAKIETLAQNAVGQAFYPQLGFIEVARQIHYAMRLDPPPGNGHSDLSRSNESSSPRP